jgi:hypothetical protein
VTGVQTCALPISANNKEGRSRTKIPSSIRKCTACDNKNTAEFIHPLLSVALCGACSKSYHDYSPHYENRKFNDGNNLLQENEFNYEQCLWCNDSDGSNLFLCDSCPYAYCMSCVKRNIGSNEVELLKRADLPWRCYLCIPTPKFKSIQVFDQLLNINQVYEAVSLSREYIIAHKDKWNDVISKLTISERRIASMFSDEVARVVLANLDMKDYLTSYDISILSGVSSNLRIFMNLLVQTNTPGLFRTDFGIDNSCELFPHQMFISYTLSVLIFLKILGILIWFRLILIIQRLIPLCSNKSRFMPINFCLW